MHIQALYCRVCGRVIAKRKVPALMQHATSKVPCRQCQRTHAALQHDDKPDALHAGTEIHRRLEEAGKPFAIQTHLSDLFLRNWLPIDTPEHNPNPETTRSSAMNINVNLLRNDFQTVVVTFDESVNLYKKQYTYKLPKSITVAEGDKLLVIVRSRNPDEYKTVTVVSVDKNPKINPDAQFSYKWAIGRLDDIMATHAQMEAKDTRIQSALATLDAALARVEASTKLKMALEQLPSDVAAELKELFEFANPTPSVSENDEYKAGGTD